MTEPKKQARPYIGGQAVIEGVMMRSPSSLSIVCRRRSGELVVRERPMTAPTTAGPRSWPLFRGVYTVVESLRLGSQALRWSAELYEKDLNAAESASSKLAAALGSSVVALVNVQGDEPATSPGEKKGGGLASALPILFAIGLFVAA